MIAIWEVYITSRGLTSRTLTGILSLNPYKTKSVLTHFRFVYGDILPKV